MVKKKDIIKDSYILVVGYTFPLNSKFKEMEGWNFNFRTKTWWKLASENTLEAWKRILESNDVSVVFSTSNNESSMQKFQDLHREAKKIEKEELNLPDAVIEHKPIESAVTGLVIEVKNWYAKKFAENTNSPLAFKNMKILAVYKESDKAYLVDCEYFAGISVSCGVCGAALTNKISQAASIGPVCAAKFGLARMNKSNAEAIMKEINEKCAKIGIAKQQWIPKSQIKRVVDPETKKVVAKFDEYSNLMIWRDYSSDNEEVSEQSSQESME